ncbi:beta-ketoacyl-[acyl-carrier-protein] synthase II [Henriciella barbarensis]|uniref:3-oxoacyl-[acyl-carrier-protein] synthase 2 n=1 Tax=Henriciella barbarensis TaxID=86342 RepID=A0A399QVX9_9PROT|nr:beta-ketoacyl-ACP synthase II [Henriciella barbarensis]RIJ22255.1 beta-ketoacyl-[acyl-carrier-protein] synthase II [Henriciella barbarensis]
MRRVVITGIGLVSPLASGREATWERLLAGKSGAGPIDLFDTKDVPCKIACQVPWNDGTGRGGGSADDPHSFDPDKAASAKERRRIDEFILYALAAADECVEDSGWKAETDEQKERTGVLIGSGIGGLQSIYDTAITLHTQGARRVSPFFIPSALINLASGQVSIRHGFKGPNHSVVTACATGAHAIGDSARLIQYGDADLMLAGGSEAVICEIGIAGFCAAKAMSTNFNDTPEKASRPYDKDRDGFVMGEGAAIVMLEEYEHAKARGAKIYAEVAGYGLTGDAYHITAPAEGSEGGYRAMKMALDNSGLDVTDIDYVNTHGTSTPKGDEGEIGAVERLFGEHAKNLSLSSTKSAVGHLLGAAGAIESAFCALALRDQVMPPTLNLDNPSVETDIDLIPHNAKKGKVRAAMSNSFGFGGTNACLILKQAD